jgi:hypothetical protein
MRIIRTIPILMRLEFKVQTRSRPLSALRYTTTTVALTVDLDAISRPLDKLCTNSELAGLVAS